MSRKIKINKLIIKPDLKYNSLLISLLINKLLQNGKKSVAKKIVYDSLDIIFSKINKDPIFILEKSIKKISPKVQLKARRIGGANYQVPVILTRLKSTKIALKWLILFSRKRIGNSMSVKLANEILEIYKGIGNSLKKKEETHKMAEANKAFLQLK